MPPFVMRVAICSAVMAAAYNGTCPAAGTCSSGSDAGLPCCQISEDSYECCYTAESCVPKVGCRCRRAESPEYTFETYLKEHGKAYAGEEYSRRQQLFEASLETIRKHNAEYRDGKHTWWMAVNHLADLTEDEFKAMRSTNYKPSEHPTVQLESEAGSNPLSVDWRTKNAVTPVKNQAQCGSCWAFSATETVESHYAIATGNLVELAPQAYVNCVKNPEECGGTGGCEGATMELAFNLTVSAGLPLEKDLPYAGVDQSCSQYKAAVKATGYVKLPVNDASALETALATKGPVSVTVAAGAWGLYGGGVFSGCDTDLDHGVQAVGYGVDGDGYWLVRNSWGAGWGEQGYIRVSRANDAKTAVDSSPADGVACKPYPQQQTVGGECGILFDTSYPTGFASVAQDVVV